MSANQLLKDGSIEIGESVHNIESLCDSALEHLPEKAIGVVVAGEDVSNWNSRGWKTFNVDPRSNPDILGDANNLSKILGDGSQDFVFVEGLPNVDLGGFPGVTDETLVLEVFNVLKPSGYFIWHTNAREKGNVCNGNSVKDTAALLRTHGFSGLAVQSEEVHVLGTQDEDLGTYRTVKYYAKKI